MGNKPEIINPPNRLRSKVKAGGPRAIDADALKRAEAAIADMADQYLDWVVQDLEKIGAAYEELKRSDQSDIRPLLKSIYQVSHDIKGQGGSFGFDMMTLIGHKLCRQIEHADTNNPKLVESIGVYIDSLNLVISQRMTGDGGKTGEKMLEGLDQIFSKTTIRNSAAD